VGVVLKEWLDRYISELDAKVIEKLQSLFDEMEIAGHNVVADHLRALATDRIAELQRAKRERRRLDPLASSQLLFRIPEGGLTGSGVILRFEPAEIARQQTLVQSRLYGAVKPSELLNQAWNNPKLQWKATNVIDLISRSNKFAFWVATLVVSPSTARTRARVIGKLVEVGEELHAHGNYDSLMGIIAGLNVSAVSRLTHTWGKVEKHARDRMKKLQAIFDPSNSHKAYRTAYSSARANGPAIPYLGTPLTDLTFTEDGNDDTLNNDPTLVNFRKNTLIIHLIQDFLMGQDKRHLFPVIEPLHSFLLELPCLGDKDLYDISLLREPRGMTQPIV
jgi:Rap guanine nucleotide exchange factor 1